jgi:hypothetical protein
MNTRRQRDGNTVTTINPLQHAIPTYLKSPCTTCPATHWPVTEIATGHKTGLYFCGPKSTYATEKDAQTAFNKLTNIGNRAPFIPCETFKGGRSRRHRKRSRRNRH